MAAALTVLTRYLFNTNRVSQTVGNRVTEDWRRWLQEPDRRTPTKMKAHAKSQTWNSVWAGRSVGADLARSYYDVEREERLGDTRDVDLLQFASFGTLWDNIEAELDATDLTDETTFDGLAKRIGGVAQEDAARGARQQMLGQTAEDPDCLGWARVDFVGTTCAFCTVLISRGLVYSEETVSFAAHPRCTCSGVPVFSDDDWPGRDQYEEANRLYVTASKEAKGTDLDVIQTLRKQIETKDK